MIRTIWYVVSAVCSVAVVLMLFRFLGVVMFHLKIFSGIAVDVKADEIIRKATLIADLSSYSQDPPPKNRLSWAIENAMSITADVMLQNGINPRDYNLKALVQLARYQQGLATPEGGDKTNGKS